MQGKQATMVSPTQERAILCWLMLDSRVVIGQVWCNRLFSQAFPGGRDQCGIFGKSRLISSA